MPITITVTPDRDMPEIQTIDLNWQVESSDLNSLDRVSATSYNMVLDTLVGKDIGHLRAIRLNATPFHVTDLETLDEVSQTSLYFPNDALTHLLLDEAQGITQRLSLQPTQGIIIVQKVEVPPAYRGLNLSTALLRALQQLHAGHQYLATLNVPTDLPCKDKLVQHFQRCSTLAFTGPLDDEPTLLVGLWRGDRYRRDIEEIDYLKLAKRAKQHLSGIPA